MVILTSQWQSGRPMIQYTYWVKVARSSPMVLSPLLRALVGFSWMICESGRSTPATALRSGSFSHIIIGSRGCTGTSRVFCSHVASLCSQFPTLAEFLQTTSTRVCARHPAHIPVFRFPNHRRFKHSVVLSYQRLKLLVHHLVVMADLSSFDRAGLQAALDQARKSYSEGGIPIGAALVALSPSRTTNEPPNIQVLGSGHNRRMQDSSPILHGETAALDNAGRLRADVYRGATMVGSSIYSYTIRLIYFHKIHSLQH